MTTSTIRLMHCDFAGCDAQDPAEGGYVADRADGWVDAIYTHGCPEHGDEILAHAAKLTSDTRGRGRSEKTTWFLSCSCGWKPAQPWQTHSTDYLRRAHLAHVREQTAA